MKLVRADLTVNGGHARNMQIYYFTGTGRSQQIAEEQRIHEK